MNTRKALCFTFLLCSSSSMFPSSSAGRIITGLAREIGNLSVIEKSIIATIGGLYVWYLKRKPAKVRCTLNDVVCGKNLQHIIPDFIPGHPKVSGKVTLKSEKDETVEIIYKDDIEGAGIFYLIESNAKNIAKTLTAMAIVMGVMVAHKSSDNLGQKVDEWFAWLITKLAKIKP